MQKRVLSPFGGINYILCIKIQLYNFLSTGVDNFRITKNGLNTEFFCHINIGLHIFVNNLSSNVENCP